ncbi:MAG: GTP-binding protein [Flavobacteriaceae bacterium]|nr:GTP-binding protein [Flavobacteriaceae bacterium]
MFLKNVRFIKSSSKSSECPNDKRNEFAFIGRSNVGKSSLINSLIQKKGLAKTSKSPGKTQLINHFLIDDAFYLVDLPGFGYSKLSKSESEKIKRISTDYITNRKNLKKLFLLIDIRHEPVKSDIDYINFLIEYNIQFDVIFTKIDKLKEKVVKQKFMNYKNFLIEKTFNQKYFLTSSSKKTGLEDLRNYLLSLSD